MRITKTVASDVAVKLLIKKMEQLDKLKIELSVKATEISFGKINLEVLEFQKKHFNYLKNVKQVEFISIINGTRQELGRIDLNKSIPSPNNSYYRHIELSVEEFKVFEKLINNIEFLRLEYKKTLAIVEQTIFNLRTAIQLQKHFPEAYALVPKETNGTMLPMVNLDQVRALVSNN